MKITRAQLKETLRTIMKEESEYQQFFKKALEKSGKSITDMSDEEKKAFFTKIDAAWDGKGEKNEGNAFGAAVTAAKEKGEDEFKVGGKTYKVESVNEAETFTATNKATGKTSVFKTKDSRDAAVKAGTHTAIKDPNDSGKTKSGVNIFNNPTKSSNDKGDDGFGWGPETDRTPATSLPKKASQLNDKHASVVADTLNKETGLDGYAEIDDNTGAIRFTASKGDEPTYTLFIGSNEDYGKPNEFRVSFESTYGEDPAGLDGEIDKSFKTPEEAMAFAAQVAKKYKKELEMNDDTNESLKSITEASYVSGYTLKAKTPYEFVNGAYAILNAYLRDEELGPKGKKELQNILKSLEYMRKYFFFKLNESVTEARGLNKSYVMYLAVDKKLKELEAAQKQMAQQYFAEKDEKKKAVLLDKLKKGTKVLQYTRKNLTDLETNYVMNLDKDAEYQGESVTEAIAVGKIVKVVDNPHWEAALGKKGPFKRKVKMIDGDNVFFTDGSNSSMKYVKESVESVNEGRAFINAAKKAKAEGKTEFEFNGKTYPVTIKD